MIQERPGSSKESRLGPVRFVTRGREKALLLLAMAAFIGGLAEALFLVTVTRAALAITNGADRVGVVAGMRLDVSTALLVALVLAAVKLGLAALGSWQSAAVSSAVVGDIRRRLASAFLDGSWELQQSERAGSLQELLTTFAGQATALVTSVGVIVLATANLVALVGLAIAVDPPGALVLVATVALLGSVLRPLRAAVRRRARASAEAGMAFATSLNEVSELGLELQVFHVQDAARRRVGDLIELTRVRARRVQFASGLTTPVYSGLAYMALIAALAVVAASDSADLNSLGAVMLIMLRSLSHGQSLQNALTVVVSSGPFVRELEARLHRFTESHRHDGGEPVGAVGDIVAQAVDFAYDQDSPVLRDISFTIRSREIVGIVGPSGSGKSTLVQLLLGLRDPDQGVILAGDRPIGCLSRAEWARKVTFVPQHAHLIRGTVADNIRFLRDDVSDDDIVHASRLAHLHEDIARLSDGYQHQVGEHGGHLSGGQQQRLCIARALVERPDVMILDEPTSALDVRSEHLVRTTLLDLKKRMTVVIIAHRLSTLEICDRIMVIQDGELKGFDTPAELERSSAFYSEALLLAGLR